MYISVSDFDFLALVVLDTNISLRFSSLRFVINSLILTIINNKLVIYSLSMNMECLTLLKRDNIILDENILCESTINIKMPVMVESLMAF